MTVINNPILPGFHPDPSILRVKDDYYIATSTFEWYPGVCIYHSNDLVNWQLVALPLNRLSQLDMRGNPDSCGVWAPCLSYKNGLFYLAFTDVKRFAGDFKDTHNYLVTSPSICGEWSEPVYLNSSGFDPSFFHDDDGKSYYLNMLWNHLPAAGRNNFSPAKYFGGIVMQEFNTHTQQLTGESKLIYSGSPIGLSEGPHLYKRDGYYYCCVAEGGTGIHHASTFARSKKLWGPYETDPQGPMVTSHYAPQASLKRAGHGDLVESASGDWYFVHLCSRPLPYRGRSVMGRETAIQPVRWSEDGWPRLTSGGQYPDSQVTVASSAKPRTHRDQRIEFNGAPLPLNLQSLRYPLPENVATQAERQGYLRLYGKESLGSWFEQSLLARRQQAFCFSAQTQLDFAPSSKQHMAGLVCYYNSKKYFYLHITHDKKLGRVLDVAMCCNNWHSQYPLASPIQLPESGEVTLKADVVYDRLVFSYATGDKFTELPLELDYSVLCDEVGDGGADANFTGAFVGIGCQDLDNQTRYADFAWFDYKEHPPA